MKFKILGGDNNESLRSLTPRSSSRSPKKELFDYESQDKTNKGQTPKRLHLNRNSGTRKTIDKMWKPRKLETFGNEVQVNVPIFSPPQTV